MVAAGGVTIASLIAPGVLGHDDHEKDDRDDRDKDDDLDDHDDHDDDGSDRHDDDIRPSGDVPAGSTQVIIDDDDADAFQPGTVTIDVGQSVTWVNLDDDPHTATGAGFDTGTMQPGNLATVTFDEPGSFPYSCQFHPEMVGQVDVRDESGTVPAAGGGNAASTPSASPQASPATGSGKSESVAITNLAFDPASLTISVGTTVTWTNHEAIPHTATADDGSFDSGMMNEGDTFEFTFGSPGTFGYSCAIHPNMTATIDVTA
jgi:plastocyanin